MKRSKPTKKKDRVIERKEKRRIRSRRKMEGRWKEGKLQSKGQNTRFIRPS